MGNGLHGWEGGGCAFASFLMAVPGRLSAWVGATSTHREGEPWSVGLSKLGASGACGAWGQSECAWVVIQIHACAARGTAGTPHRHIIIAEILSVIARGDARWPQPDVAAAERSGETRFQLWAWGGIAGMGEYTLLVTPPIA